MQSKKEHEANVNTAGPDLCEDRAWLDSFRAGRKDALERVFRTYAPLVNRIILHGTHGPDGSRIYVTALEDQHDLVQETFLRVLSPDMRAGYDGVRPYGAFIRVVARNLMVDHLRKQGRLEAHFTPMEDAHAEAVNPEQIHGDESLLSREEQQMMAQFLETLDGEERMFVSVRFRQGLSQRDAAQKLGVTRQRIRTLDERVRQKLDAFIKQREVNTSPLQPTPRHGT